MISPANRRRPTERGQIRRMVQSWSRLVSKLHCCRSARPELPVTDRAAGLDVGRLSGKQARVAGALGVPGLRNPLTLYAKQVRMPDQTQGFIGNREISLSGLNQLQEATVG